MTWRAEPVSVRGASPMQQIPKLCCSRVLLDQQSVTDNARPASLVSLYLLFMSFAVSASAWIVASRSIRCREAISLLAISYAVHALTAPNAHRSTHGTCT